ncbi:hypothetical protein GSI_04242 [Ganoderma sinense ZZ0214-1]|uniref:Uncharacterized protein n=1 Tax=Ganoderma sinense ZZ0214-1 TaxID=1077348 RepID=A0A2G8SIM3_9APHY|nr:hypothetical protein GSI_04242 [Ganoderma sinense ZZ0214-1]
MLSVPSVATISNRTQLINAQYALTSVVTFFVLDAFATFWRHLRAPTGVVGRDVAEAVEKRKGELYATAAREEELHRKATTKLSTLKKQVENQKRMVAERERYLAREQSAIADIRKCIVDKQSDLAKIRLKIGHVKRAARKSKNGHSGPPASSDAVSVGDPPVAGPSREQGHHNPIQVLLSLVESELGTTTIRKDIRLDLIFFRALHH